MRFLVLYFRNMVKRILWSNTELPKQRNRNKVFRRIIPANEKGVLSCKTTPLSYYQNMLLKCSVSEATGKAPIPFRSRRQALLFHAFTIEHLGFQCVRIKIDDGFLFSDCVKESFIFISSIVMSLHIKHSQRNICLVNNPLVG